MRRPAHPGLDFRSRLGAGSRRSRGITLIATVLLTALAATIALVAVRQTVLVTRAESARTDYGRAYTEALVVQAQFERQLRDDPRFYLTHVFAWERPRHCESPPSVEGGVPVFYTDPAKHLSVDFPWVLPPVDPRDPGAGLDPGDGPAGRWPASCGTTWSYLGVGQPLRGQEPQAARAEILPPTAADPVVTLRVLARSGGSEAGLVATYRTPPVSAFTVYSGADLKVDQVFFAADPDAPATVEGAVYAAGKLWGPAGPATVVGRATLMGEESVAGVFPAPARVYSGAPGQVGSGVADLRDLVAAPRTFPELIPDVAALTALGCRGLPAAALENYTGSQPAAGHSSELCLAAGGPALTAGGDLVRFPDRVAGWLLLPDGDQLRVYTAADLSRPAGDCVIRCDLGALSQAARHPGNQVDTGLWDYRGSFEVPASGVVAADADVYLSRCEAFTVAPAAGHGCGAATWPGADITQPDGLTGGVVADGGFTVVAGTVDRPADLWVQGSVGVDPAAATGIGLVATGRLRFPYWSHTPGGDLHVTASLLALDLGAARPGQAGVVGYPEVFAAPTDADAGAWGRDLRVVGSVAAPTLTRRVDGFTRTVVVPADRQPAPAFPGFGADVVRESNGRLTPAALCGSATSCYGVW